MARKFTLQSYKNMLLLCCILIASVATAQIGIGTTSPDPSSILDITSTTQGLLAPRMTTTQRNAIAAPTDGLLVYDTTLKLFYYYSTGTATWNPLNSTSSGRLNFKRIKSTDVLATVLASEKAAGGGSKYLMNTNTLYEINGQINFDLPIDINNAYITGQDANEDIISSTAPVIFQGATGGSIRFLTLKGIKAFEINGPGIATSSSFLIQNVIVDGMTGSVGNIGGLGLVFGNIVQFINNANGIRYYNIGNLLLNSQAWLSSNNGVFETFTDSFGLIQKNSGFSTTSTGDTALDVSSSTLAVGTGILLGTVFSGTAGTYVLGYAPAATYPGYNFSTAWTVDSPGIPREGDSDATGDINLVAAIGTGATTTFTTNGAKVKIAGTTTSNNLFRFTKDGNNRIVYKGNKPRYFQVAASVSYQGTASDMTLVLYLAKNGTVLTDTKVYGRPASGFFTSASGILALPIMGTIQLKKDDYIEIFGERYDGTGNISVVSLNLTAR
jgi:hypothetical protein